MTTATDITTHDTRRDAPHRRAFADVARIGRLVLLVAAVAVGVDAAGALAVKVGGSGGTVGGPDAVGTSQVVLGVDENGRVTDCTVAASSGRADLDARACGIAYTRFKPKAARRNGRPVRSTMTVPIGWTAAGAATK